MRRNCHHWMQTLAKVFQLIPLNLIICVYALFARSSSGDRWGSFAQGSVSIIICRRSQPIVAARYPGGTVQCPQYLSRQTHVVGKIVSIPEAWPFQLVSPPIQSHKECPPVRDPPRLTNPLPLQCVHHESKRHPLLIAMGIYAQAWQNLWPWCLGPRGD